jgi:hypothetical protein
MQRRRLYYVPGLISIIGLPILLYFMGPEDHIYYTVLKFNLPTNKKDSAGVSRFSEANFFKLIRNKKKVTVDVNDEGWDDRTRYAADRKFNFVTQELERMQFTGDTSKVLEVSLGEKNTYGDYVGLIERAKLYDVHRYAYINDCFYYIPDRLPGRPPTPALLPDSFPIINIPLPPEPSKWDKIKRDINEWFFEAAFVIRQNYPLTIGFLALILIPAGIWVFKYRSQSGREH